MSEDSIDDSEDIKALNALRDANYAVDIGYALGAGPDLNRQTQHAANVRGWWDALRWHPKLPADLAVIRRRMIDSAAKDVGDWWPVGDEWPLVGGDVSVRRDALEQILREEWDGGFTGAESVRLSEANIIKMNLAGRFLTEAVDPLLDRYPNLHTISPNLQREHVGIVFRSAVMRATSSTREGTTAGWAEAGEDLAGALWTSREIVGSKVWGALCFADPGPGETGELHRSIRGEMQPPHQRPAPTITLTLWPGAGKTEALGVFDTLWETVKEYIEPQVGMKGGVEKANRDYKALVGVYRHYLSVAHKYPNQTKAVFIRRLAEKPQAAEPYWPTLKRGKPAARFKKIEQKLTEATGWLDWVR